MEIQKKIWDFCKANGMTDAGAAAVLGNIEVESAFASKNVENRCPISDDEYAELIALI